MSKKTYFVLVLFYWFLFLMSSYPIIGHIIFVFWVPTLWVINKKRAKKINRPNIGKIASIGATCAALMWQFIPLNIEFKFLTKIYANIIFSSAIIFLWPWAICTIVLVTNSWYFEYKDSKNS